MDLPHMATCLALEEKYRNDGIMRTMTTVERRMLDGGDLLYDRLIETIADLEKAKSAVDRALYLLYEMRASHPRNSYK